MGNSEMSLFNYGKFTSHSGLELDWKIDCDSLTDSDFECLAKVIGDRFLFGSVYGIPNGGTKLAKCLEKYVTPGVITRMVVDDVWTTGKSMMDELGKYDEGVVIFARQPIPKNTCVTALFTGNYL